MAKRKRVTDPQDRRWLAGLLDGRGVVEVGRQYPKGRCKILPDIAIEFDVSRKNVAEVAAAAMDGKVKTIRNGKRVLVFVRGWAKLAGIAREITPYMKDEAKRRRLEAIAERVTRPNPSVCTREEALAPRDGLSEITFSGCPKPLKAWIVSKKSECNVPD